MPAAGELKILSGRLIVPAVEHALQIIAWGRFVLARAEAERFYRAAMVSHNERTRNTLKHCTCSHKWWES